ncbi:MAG: glycerophosphodiester phosphodiesterase [Calothrix sp. MO_192.B10]|nr:glycerophosphodiester phosphodiesterase [Calothrix sp. MO_192.B10]MDJ0734714.1 glycerophosphodiester phosphodiesterase [Nostocaceae cyanobacterium]
MTTTVTQQPPIVIAHRGASGYRPEHTLAAYKLAIEMGANFIEPDLVSTKDGILIARHENEMSQTTDVVNHPEFAHRRTTKIIDGEVKNGWFTEDFTLGEIKTLRAKERIPQIRPQNAVYDGKFDIPTFQEIIDLVKGKTIGIYPETKHPSYFQSIGLPLEEPLLEVLHGNGYRGDKAPIFIQSFEVNNLKQLSQKTDLPLVQLLNDTGKPYDVNFSYQDLATVAGLRDIAEYALAIGVNKNLVVPRDRNNKLLSPTSLINDAHGVNLLVHAWTFRNEDFFLPLDFQGNPQGEYELFFGLGIDGVFSDFPDIGLRTIEV